MTPNDRGLVEQLQEHEVLAVTAFLEARSEPVQGIVGVMWTVLNRARRHHCGRSIVEVCLWPKQYSCWNDRDPNQQFGVELARHLRGGESIAVIPDGIVLTCCLFLAERLLDAAEAVVDPTAGATHYFAPRAVRGTPAWADPARGATATITIGAHRFFRNVP